MLINRRQFLQQTTLSASALAASVLLQKMRQKQTMMNNKLLSFTPTICTVIWSHFLWMEALIKVVVEQRHVHKIINEIRSKNKHVLLLDAGDIFGNTPIFEMFKGEPEIIAMSAMKYEAVTIGEQDFLAGINNYADKLNRFANFPVVICNYDFTNTSLEHKTLPYIVAKRGTAKIGVTGVGIGLQGLIADNLYGKTKCLNPIENANKTADILKRKEGCDLVICLSHLGDKYNDDTISDEVLAKESYDIDLIIGGHTHRFFSEPRKYINKRGKEIIVNTAGWAGMQLGRLDYNLLKNGKKFLDTKSILIGKKYED